MNDRDAAHEAEQSRPVDIRRQDPRGLPRLNEELKSWLDNVVVPILVQQYQRERTKTRLAIDIPAGLTST